MDMTKHSQKRGQQRGVPCDVVDVLLQVGDPTPCAGDAFRYTLRATCAQEEIQQLRHRIRCLEQAVKVTAVVKDESVLTVYVANSSQQRKEARRWA